MRWEDGNLLSGWPIFKCELLVSGSVIHVTPTRFLCCTSSLCNHRMFVVRELSRLPVAHPDRCLDNQSLAKVAVVLNKSNIWHLIESHQCILRLFTKKIASPNTFNNIHPQFQADSIIEWTTEPHTAGFWSMIPGDLGFWKNLWWRKPLEAEQEHLLYSDIRCIYPWYHDIATCLLRPQACWWQDHLLYTLQATAKSWPARESEKNTTSNETSPEWTQRWTWKVGSRDYKATHHSARWISLRSCR